MRIEIKDRLTPFSHVPGTCFVLPYSFFEVQAFPTKLIFAHLETQEKFEISFSVKGPHRDFTVAVDLDKGCLRVFSHTLEGYYRYNVAMGDKGIEVTLERAFGKVDVLCKEEKFSLFPKQTLLVKNSGSKIAFPEVENLSLGGNKQLDWDLVKRRGQLSEILPVWFRLSQVFPRTPLSESRGTAKLLRDCQTLVQDKSNLSIGAVSLTFFAAAFQGVFVPRCDDHSFLGVAEACEEKFPPLGLITESHQWIRGMFFEEKGDDWHFLPCVPQEFHAGRLVHLKTQAGDRVDFEWSKKQMRRAVIKVAKTRNLRWHFQSSLGSLRVRSSLNQRGKKIRKGEALFVEEGQTLYLDHFQK